MKTCPSCNQELTLSAFKYQGSNPINGRSKNCRKCIHAIHKRNNRKPTTIRKKPAWLLNALERDNYQCRDCGTREGRLVVHHIDESRKLGLAHMNNSLDNLVTVCKSCHAHRHHQIISRAEVIKLRETGITFQEIANKLGLTRQRVHQIYRHAIAS